MLYLHNITEAQALFIPKDGITATGDLSLYAKSTIDLDMKFDVHVIDLETSDLYYNLAVTLPADIPNGEYEYTLTDGVSTLSTGLLVIGDNFHPSQYEKTITYEQYETE